MANAATWLVVVGFFLLVLGFVLRTILMMRSSDLIVPGGRVLHGRELLREYGKRFPGSTMLQLISSVLFGGLMLLMAGIAVEIAR